MSVPIWPVWHSRFFKIVTSVFWFTSELLACQLFNFLFFNLHYPISTSGFHGKIILPCSSGNYIEKIFFFLRDRIKSSQKRGKHVLAAILPILHLVAVLWKMKDCWLLLCKDLYLEFLALFYFAYEKDRQSYSYTDILNPV